MSGSYQEIFTHRGGSYHAAMTSFPNARDNEFRRLFDHVDLNHVRTVLDIPAGGGYLAKYLPRDVALTQCDPAAGFVVETAKVDCVDLSRLELPPEHFDCVVSMAALHHIEPKQPFLRSLLESVRPGGHLLIGDVLQGSKEARFLDGFVGRFNQTGHEGQYLTGRIADDLNLKDAQARLVDERSAACPWTFADRDQMIAFATGLFAMSGVSDSEVGRVIESTIGTRQTDSGIEMHWTLQYTTIQKL